MIKRIIPAIYYSKQSFISRGVALGKEGVVIRIAMILNLYWIYISIYIYIRVYVSFWVLSHPVRRLSFSVGDACKLSFRPQSFQPFWDPGFPGSKSKAEKFMSYPSSHNHGSGNWVLPMLASFQFRVVFPFHDYGRKSTKTKAPFPDNGFWSRIWVYIPSWEAYVTPACNHPWHHPCGLTYKTTRSSLKHKTPSDVMIMFENPTKNW